jgi:hypothetical protein
VGVAQARAGADSEPRRRLDRILVGAEEDELPAALLLLFGDTFENRVDRRLAAGVLVAVG